MPTELPKKHLFAVPDGLIYLDGNSLGPLPKSVPGHVNKMMLDEWGIQLIRGWNEADWMGQPARVGNLIAPLIGAPMNTVVMGDTLSIKVYQAVSAALSMRQERRVILSDTGNFPTDLYMVEGLIDLLGDAYELRLVEPDAVGEAINDEVAVVLLTQVDYRTGRLHDMETITATAHDAGAVMVWDLAHSAGALRVDIAGSKAEFAVGCTYKYLNGGPGAPAFIYVRPDLVDEVKPVLSGWLGHASPFAFDLTYQAAPSIERMRVGTPPVVQLSALQSALQVWDGVDMNDVRAKSIALSELFITEMATHCPDLRLLSPRDPLLRGSQVSFCFEHGFCAMQALIDRGVIGDFRAPDVMRFGITPLYLDEDDIIRAAKILHEVLSKNLWKDPKYQQKTRVT